MDHLSVEVILSCKIHISLAKVGWYHTAEGILHNKADTSDHACVNLKILSIKTNTSLPSTSLKYSAIVNPLKATLDLGPGVSFICQ